MKLPALLLVIITLTAQVAGAQQLDEIELRRRELDNLRIQIEERQRKARELSQKESSILDAVHRTERLLEERQRALNSVKSKNSALAFKLQVLTAQLDVAQQRHFRTLEQLKKRLRSLYKLRRGGWLRVLFSSESLSELGTKLHLTERLIRNDRKLIDDYVEQQRELVEKETALREQAELIDLAEQEAQLRAGELKRLYSNKQRVLDDVKQSKSAALKAVKELEVARLEMSSLVKRLSGGGMAAVSIEAGNFGELKGVLPAPVIGTMVEGFGRIQNERFNTVTINNGVRLRVPAGTPVHSVFPGKVAFSGGLKGYGKIMIVDHGGGYVTVYAHLSRQLKQVGDPVDHREVIGLSGDSGSLLGPVLYFEVRENGRPSNPSDWIQGGF